MQMSARPLSSCEVNTEVKGVISLKSNELESKQTDFLDDGFVFGLEGSGLERPKGKVGECYMERSVFQQI